MAENIRTTPLRLNPSEHRTILFVGDLLMGIASIFAAIEVWRRYNFSVEVARLTDNGFGLVRAQQLASEFVSLSVPFWFYLLPIIWMLLLVELYEPHIASSGRRSARGIAVAAFIGIAVYSLVFIIQQDTNLPRIGVGAFLLFASVLTLSWRMIFIRIYKRTGELRRILLVGAGRGGQTLADLYTSRGTRSFNIIGFIDDDVEKVGQTIHKLPVLGTSRQLLDLIDIYRISDIVVAIHGEIQGATFQTILDGSAARSARPL